MKSKLSTVEVMKNLNALAEHYTRLTNCAKERGDKKAYVEHACRIDAVKVALHEVELLASEG